MKLAGFAFLADQNVHADVTHYLLSRGIDVVTVEDVGMGTASDTAIIRRAVAEGRVVISHDSDFGRLSVASREPVVGILYLRPGHIQPAFTIQMIATVLELNPECRPPFLVVAERRHATVKVRIRCL